MVRLFVGGLAQDITSDQLASRFQTFGKVTNSTVIAPKENDTCISSTSACRGFGYLDLEPANESALRKCLTVYNGSKWRGGVLRVQPAKQHFLEKLQLEWAEEKAQGEESRQKRQEEDKQMQKSREAPVSETPLILTSLDGKEFEVRSNKCKTTFAEHGVKIARQAAWESVPPPPGLLRKEAFEKAMDAVFDAAAAREAWKEAQQAAPLSPASSAELGAVTFAEDESAVDQKAVDLSRFSDEEE